MAAETPTHPLEGVVGEFWPGDQLWIADLEPHIGADYLLRWPTEVRTLTRDGLRGAGEYVAWSEAGERMVGRIVGLTRLFDPDPGTNPDVTGHLGERAT